MMNRKKIEKMTTAKLIMTRKTYKLSFIAILFACGVFLFNSGWLLALICGVFGIIGLKKTKTIVNEVLSERTITEEDNRLADALVKKQRIIVVVAMAVMLFCFSMGQADYSSSKSKKPWKELGVSEREYMETYNYIAEGMPR